MNENFMNLHLIFLVLLKGIIKEIKYKLLN